MVRARWSVYFGPAPISFLFLSVVLASSRGAGGATAPLKNAPVAYRVGDLVGMGGLGRSLAVKVGAKSRKVIAKLEADDPACLALEEVKDFDGNGTQDALVRSCQACGGNAVADVFFFMVNTGNRTFRRTASFPPEGNASLEGIELWGGRMSVIVCSTGEGGNTDDAQEKWGRYILEGGNPVMVDSYEPPELEASFEIRSRIFDGECSDLERRFTLTLRKDGAPAEIHCHYWPRWGRMGVTIRLPDGSDFTPEASPKRVGVLASMTLGWHDLVFDRNQVYRWNGITYVEAPSPSRRSYLTRRPEESLLPESSRPWQPPSK